MEEKFTSLKQDISSFIWNFKVQDNIEFNLEILESMIRDYNAGKKLYAKPISIITVAVIEVIMIDFIYRLNKGTNHFPKSLSYRKEEIKKHLKNKKYKKDSLKNIQYGELVELFERFNLLGTAKYKNLINMGYYRNRLHILNYHGNLEKDEALVFNDKRTKDCFKNLRFIVTYMKENYPRWKE